jgi:hypothetical protein
VYDNFEAFQFLSSAKAPLRSDHLSWLILAYK